MAHENLRIVLVETAGPLNLGSVARVMKNFGLKNLVLVNPQCNPKASEAYRMAVHAKDVLELARQVNSLEEALDGCSRVVATTARHCESPLPWDTPKTAIPWLTELPNPQALIFGPEERGLSTAELQWAQCWMTIPTNPEYATLNLAQAVALCCYEIYQLTTLPSLKSKTEPSATIETMEACLTHMAEVLLDIGYLHAHTKTKRMEKFRRLLYRSSPSSSEMALLRGVWAQVQWALKKAGFYKD